MKKLVFAVIALGFSVGANAACDTKSLKGDFYYGVTGLDNGMSCANVGVVNFDGKGNVKSHSVSGCGKEVQEGDLTAIYQLNSSCLGSITTNLGFTYHFVTNKAVTVGNIFISQSGAIGYGTMQKQ